VAAEEQMVELTELEGVAELVLNRAAKRNAMNAPMVAQLRNGLAEIRRSSARAVLVRAEGGSFSAGRDISDAAPGTEDGGAILEGIFNPLMLDMSAVPVPTFAAVQGACLGTGLGLALACDVIYAADDAKLGSPFARIGAVLDSGAHHAFVSRIGSHRALELIYSGRLLTGAEAAQWGLINASLPAEELLSHARSAARVAASGPTQAFSHSKRLVRALADGDSRFADSLAEEAEAQRAASRTQDYVEGFTAFLEKRQPTFRGQ
jgi:2-(1,2-epoxy-1,2-dihydrophenyl)acetyl-CoA isomerase